MIKKQDLIKYDIPKLTNLLVICSTIFDRNERFSLADSVIRVAIERLKDNNCIQNVLPKVILINSFYNTQIFDTEKIANHILNSDIDGRLVSGDLSLIDNIRYGHDIRVRKTGKERDFYSFATKYVALHEPTKFPLYDNLLMRLLTELNRQLKFCSQFKQDDLRNYKKYVSVIDAILDLTCSESFKYKRFDQGLWVYAKYLYNRSNLTELEIDLIMKEEKRIVS